MEQINDLWSVSAEESQDISERMLDSLDDVIKEERFDIVE